MLALSKVKLTERIFDWLVRRRIIAYLIKQGIDNIFGTLLILVFSLAFIYIIQFMGLLDYTIKSLLDSLSIVLFGFLFVIFSLLIVVLAVVEFHDRNIKRRKEENKER